MQQLIAGVLVGVAALLLGPKLLSDLAVTLRPAGKELLHFGEAAVGTVTSTVSAAGNWASGLMGSWTGSETQGAHASTQVTTQNSEADQQEESFLQDAEKFSTDVAVGLAEEEAISFIKMALIAAL